MADAYATQLVAVDVDSGMIRVVPAPGKNVSDYLVTGLRKFVESTFHTKVRLRCDNEPAAVVIALLPGVVVLENTPRHDHAANPAERTIRSVEDQVRVLRPDVFEASLRDLHARRGCDSKGGRFCCEQSADWENCFFFTGGSVKLQHYTSTGNISSWFFYSGGLIFLCSYSFWRRSNFFLSS